MLERERIKGELKAKGWSNRRAAAAIGRHFTWISRVLNGHDTSRPVLEALKKLPALTVENQEVRR